MAAYTALCDSHDYRIDQGVDADSGLASDVDMAWQDERVYLCGPSAGEGTDVFPVEED